MPSIHIYLFFSCSPPPPTIGFALVFVFSNTSTLAVPWGQSQSPSSLFAFSAFSLVHSSSSLLAKPFPVGSWKQYRSWNPTGMCFGKLQHYLWSLEVHICTFWESFILNLHSFLKGLLNFPDLYIFNQFWHLLS